jgi:hypothetical protein
MAPSILHQCAHCGAPIQRSRRATSRHAVCSLACRFWIKVDRSGGPDACWEWTSKSVKRSKCGLAYGDFRVSRNKVIGAHRMAWELTNGPIPDGLCVCHKCDNPLCCNPSHHFLGTRADNVADMLAKGRKGVISPEGREKLRAERLGKKRDPRIGRLISLANRGRKPSPETAAKRAASLRGHKHSEESKRRMSEALRAAWVRRRQANQDASK